MSDLVIVVMIVTEVVLWEKKNKFYQINIDMGDLRDYFLIRAPHRI